MGRIARLVALFSAFWINSAAAADVCPLRSGQTLQFADVFDGSPEEMAFLMPYKAEKFSGYYRLGHVFDAGRIVTIRCIYADGQTLDVKIQNKVARCDYKFDAKKTLTLSCQ